MGVFSEIKPKNDARKNPFDLSSTLMYNQKCGMIVPIKAIPTLPSSTYKFDLKSLLRTQPLKTAAFAGFSINYDLVWTPNNDHYSSFNQFIAQRLNKQHATQPDIKAIPNFSLGGFVLWLLSYACYDYFASLFPDSDWQKDSSHSWVLQFSKVLASSEQSPEESLALSAIRSLDMLEYGNFLPIVKRFGAQVYSWLTDSSNYAVPSDLTDKDFHPIQALVAYGYKHSSMADPYVVPNLATFYSNHTDLTYIDVIQAIHNILDFGVFKDAQTGFLVSRVSKDDISPDVFTSLWPVMCYNKAFWQFYRNEYYDEKYRILVRDSRNQYQDNVITSEVDYVLLFNWDDFNVNTQLNYSYFNGDYNLEGSWFTRLMCMFAIKYHQYKKDLFTAVLPSTQYGDVSVASAEDVFAKLIGNIGSENIPASSSSSLQVYSATASVSGVSNVLGQGFPNSSFNPVARSDKFKFDPAPMISVLEMRRADSLQRFKERMMRAGNKTKDIFKAHGWDEPYSEKAFDVEFLGNFDGRLDLNVVAATTDTEQVNLGQLAANGVGVISGQSITFHSHDFGTLLLVCYIVKDALYDSYGVNKMHTLLEPFDFPYPELQNISLAPVVRSEVDSYLEDASDNPFTDVIGYLPQNMVFKTQTDKIHGEFFSAPLTQMKPSNSNGNLDVGQGIFADMVTPRKDIVTPKELSFLYCQPSCADNIFAVNASVAQDSDQFFGMVKIDCKCVQPLDVIGLPI